MQNKKVFFIEKAMQLFSFDLIMKINLYNYKFTFLLINMKSYQCIKDSASFWLFKDLFKGQNHKNYWKGTN